MPEILRVHGDLTDEEGVLSELLDLEAQFPEQRLPAEEHGGSIRGRRREMGDKRVWERISWGAARSFSKRIRSWAACLSMRKASSPCSTTT